MRIPVARQAYRPVIVAIAAMAVTTLAAWFVWWQSERGITVRRCGPNAFVVEWRSHDVVEWLCSSATLRRSERIDAMNTVEVDVDSGPGWLMGVAESEWVFIGLPAADGDAVDEGCPILRGSASMLTSVPYEALRRRIHDAVLPIMLAARHGDESVNGKRGLVGLVRFKGFQLALYAAAGAGWCLTPFEGAMPIRDPSVLEHLWRCIVSRQGVADSVRHAYNLGVYSNGELGVSWDMFDKR
jgi:hypothetical protein